MQEVNNAVAFGERVVIKKKPISGLQVLLKITAPQQEKCYNWCRKLD
jgi:hypothetical protein